MTDKPDWPHEQCAVDLKEGFAKRGVEITISEESPLPTCPGPVRAFIEAIECPHGVVLWYRPTVGQFLEWRLRGVR